MAHAITITLFEYDELCRNSQNRVLQHTHEQRSTMTEVMGNKFLRSAYYLADGTWYSWK